MTDNRLKRVEWVDLKMPSLRDFDRFLGWMVGRICFSVWLFGLNVIRVTAKIAIALVDQTEKATYHLLDVYSQMPHMGIIGANYIDVGATVQVNDLEVITDIVSAIEGRQVMIIGEMGTGKSTIAQFIAYSIGMVSVKVYECEGTPTDWQGLEVIGRGEDWGAIEDGMQADLDDLTSQIQVRNERGDNALAGSERVIICEEFPELINKVPSASEWLERHARRGRKARRFTILLSQYDRVSAWGLEGKADLAEAFAKIRLGKKAVTHAKSIKRDDLVNWLRLDRSHCLIDDNPCKLPGYREMVGVTNRLSLPMVKQAETTVEPGLQDISIDILRAVRACIDAGLSDSKIIKEVLGCNGSQYQQGKKILENVKNR